MPKEDTFRGLGIFSVLVRAWHRSLSHFLPGPASDQLCANNSNVPLAIAKWFHLKFRAGAEVDLSLAYDSVPHQVAHRALCTLHTPLHVVNTLVRAWSAARFVLTAGEVSTDIRPTRSVPQGDPCAGPSFAAVTAPWKPHVVSQVPSVDCLSWV